MPTTVRDSRNNPFLQSHMPMVQALSAPSSYETYDPNANSGRRNISFGLEEFLDQSVSLVKAKERIVQKKNQMKEEQDEMKRSMLNMPPRPHSGDATQPSNQECRVIPKRKLRVLGLLQSQLKESRDRANEQNHEFIQQPHQVNKITINHNLLVNESQVNQGMFNDLKQFLDPNQNPVITLSAHDMLDQLNQTKYFHANHQPAVQLPFNIEKKKKQKKQPKSETKKTNLRIKGIPPSFTVNHVHNLILENCKIITEDIIIKEKNGLRVAHVGVKSRSEALEIKRNMDGIKVEERQMKVIIQKKAKKPAQDPSPSFPPITIDYRITEAVEEILGYSFSNKSYLMMALTFGHPIMESWSPLGKKLISQYLEEALSFEENGPFCKIATQNNEIEQGVIKSSVMKLNTIDAHLRKYNTSFMVVSMKEIVECFHTLINSIKEDCQGEEDEIKVILSKLYHPLACLVNANLTENEILCTLNKPQTRPVSNTPPPKEAKIVSEVNEINYEFLLNSREYLGKALHYTAKKSTNKTTPVILIRKGADPNFKVGGFNALMVTKSTGVVKTLIRCGAKLTELSEPHRWDILRCAIERKNIPVVKFLLQNHLDVLSKYVQASLDAVVTQSNETSLVDSKKKAKLDEIIELIHQAVPSNR